MPVLTCRPTPAPLHVLFLWFAIENLMPITYTYLTPNYYAIKSPSNVR